MRKVMNQLKNLKKDQLFIVLLSGVLLLVIALPVTPKQKENNSVARMTTDIAGNTQQSSKKAQTMEGDTVYVKEMEQKLERLLTNMDQVGRVKVILTLKASEEKIVEKDMPMIRSNTQEEDSQGGSRVVNNVDSKETTVYETDSGKSAPYVVKTVSPKVEGVVVVCEGAGNGSVSKNITEVIQVLFGIEPHKIKVAKMKTS